MSLSGTRKAPPRKIKIRPELKAAELNRLDRQEREKLIRMPVVQFQQRRFPWEK